MSAPARPHTPGPAEASGELPLTVRDVLAMPAFARARLVAGRGGIDNPVEWAHIVDIPDAAFDWGRRRVLVLTAGYGWGDDTAQRDLIPRLAARGFAGLVVSLGYAVDAVPEPLRETADEHAFPLIETPRDVLFITLTEAVFAQLVNRQYAVLQRSGDVRRELTELVLSGGGLGDAAKTLGALLNRSVTMEDRQFRVRATATAGPVDDARRRCVQAGRATAPMVRHLTEIGVYKQLLERMEPVRVEPVPSLGMTMERVVAPIIVDGDLHGYIWVIAGDHPLTALDEQAIAHGATIAALILLKERAVREAAGSERGDFVQQLLSEYASPTALADRAYEVGFRLDHAHQALLVRQTDGQISDRRRSLADEVASLLQAAGLVGMTAWRPEGVVVLLEAATRADGEAAAERLLDDLGERRPALIGVGSVAPSGTGQAAALRSSFQEACEAVDVAASLGETRSVHPFWKLGLLHWLQHVPADVRAGNPFLTLITGLADDDAAHGTSLLATLESYLDHGGAAAGAARALHLHRNTLLHRIGRIEEHLGVDLRDPLVRLDLHVALRSYRLHGS